MNWKVKLIKSIKSSNSNLVIGIDPDISKFPDFIMKYKNPTTIFNNIIIENTNDIVAGYKFNMAFYEYIQFTEKNCLESSLRCIPEYSFKICDAKRGDIPNTTEMYAKTYFDKMNFDAVTGSPYMGFDSLAPFFKRKDKLTYVLALTSNEGSKDFQQIKISQNRFLYNKIEEVFLKKNLKQNTGFVVGANHFNEIKNISGNHKDVPLLIPGIGAQNNSIEKLLKNIKNNLFLVNSSRSIIYPENKKIKESEFIDFVKTKAIFYSEQLYKK